MVILMKNDKKKVKTKLRQQDIKKYSNTEIDHVILKIKENVYKENVKNIVKKVKKFLPKHAPKISKSRTKKSSPRI